MLWFLLILIITQYSQCAEFKKHVQNSVYPYDIDPPNYNIESWAKLLHLQQCAFVEVGDNYYALFVETRPRRYDKEKDITDYFLGLCDEDNLRKWDLCSPNLMQKRSADCRLAAPEITGARVHRRLCDITTLAMNAPQCDCNGILSDSKLYKVQGFPTCFKPPLPDSLCGDNNVCGLASCTPQTINKRVHTAKCDRRCLHEQPFCEIPNRPTSKPRVIRSFWTDWSNPFCTDASCISQFDAATCINRDTWEGDLDCLGPGTSCCTPELQNCRCHVYEEDGTSKVFRTFSIPQPEVVEYMSEEDFINSIPLNFLNKEEFHKYPHRRLERSRLGKAIKQTVNNIYENRPIRLGNTKIVRQDSLRHIKSHIINSLSKTRPRYKSKVIAKSATRHKAKHSPSVHAVKHSAADKSLASPPVPTNKELLGPVAQSLLNSPVTKPSLGFPKAQSSPDVIATKLPPVNSMVAVPAAKSKRFVLPYKATKVQGEPPYQITILLEEEKKARPIKKSNVAQFDDCVPECPNASQSPFEEGFQVSTIPAADFKMKTTTMDISKMLAKVEVTQNNCETTCEGTECPGTTTTEQKIKQDDFEDSLNWEEDVDEGIEGAGENENEMSVSQNYHQKAHDEGMSQHPGSVFSRAKNTQSDDDDNAISTEGKTKRKIRNNAGDEDEDEVLRKTSTHATAAATTNPPANTEVITREEEDEDETRPVHYPHKHNKKKLRTVVEEEISDDDDDDDDDDNDDDIMIEYDEVIHKVTITTTSENNITESIKNFTETSSFIRATNINAIYIVLVVLLF